MVDLESPTNARLLRSAQEKRLRKRKDLDALIVQKGGRRKRGASQELLSRNVTEPI